MEISEGAKGPLFMVTSIGGDSCTGQTPDIAWENLQKKSGPRVKNWHGKRLSGKIDGTEFFGFRNPFVQRLLRELVANVNGLAERSLGPANFHNGALQSDSETLMQHTQRYPDLLPYLGKQQGTRKRSIICKDSIRSFSKEANTKRICFGDSPNNAERGTSEQMNRLFLYTRDNNRVKIRQRCMCLSEDRSPAAQAALYRPNCLLKGSIGVLNKITSGSPCQVNQKCSNDSASTGIATSSKGIEVVEDLGSSFKDNVGNVAEETLSLASSKEIKESKDSACFLEEPFVYHKLHKVTDCEDYSSKVLEYELLHEDKEQLDRVGDVKLENGDSLMAAKDTVGEIAVLSRFSDICIPDTFDDARDDTADFASGSSKESPCSVKNELVVPEAVMRYSKSTEDILPGNMPSELVSKIGIFSLEGRHPVPTETCTPLDTLSKGFIKDSLSELGSSSDSPNPSSGRINLDLAGQELTRSMMTFLLPRAVPLLNKTYVKRRSKRHRKLEIDCGPCSNVDGANSVEGIVGNDCFTVFPSKDNFIDQTLARKLEEKKIKELIIPGAATGIDSLCVASKVEPPAVSCKTNALPAKDVQSIVQDSVVDEPQLCHVGIKGSTGVAENDAETPPATDRGGHKQYPACTSGDDRCNEVRMQSQGPGKNQTYCVDSNAACMNPAQSTCVEQKSNDSCMNLVDKMSCDSHGDPSHPSCAKLDSPFSFDAEFLHMAEEEMLLYDGVLPCNSLKNHKTEHLQQDPLAPTPNKEFEVDALNTLSANCFCSYGSIEKAPPGCSPSDHVNVHVHKIDSTDTDGRSQEVLTHISQVALGGKTVVSRKDNSLSYVTNGAPFTGDLSHMKFKAGDPLLTSLTEKHHMPPAESTSCRSHEDNNDSKSRSTPSKSYSAEKDQSENIGKDKLGKIPTATEFNIDKKPYLPEILENVSGPESTVLSVVPGVFGNEDVAKSITVDVKTSSFINTSISYSGRNSADAASGLHVHLERKRNLSLRGSNHSTEALSCSDKDLKSATNDSKNLFSQICQENQLDELMSKKSNSKNKLGNHLDLVGCYLHPYPVLCTFLRSKSDHLQVCVLCGIFDEKGRNLFMYMVPTKGQAGSCPSFLGYTSLVFPVREDPFDGNISFERHVLQLTPEGQSLVFLNSIKAPRCSEQNINCLCSECNSDPAEENGLEVALVKSGYVVTVTKLKTPERVRCILVCEPDFLVAAEVSGRLHVWIMNCRWSVNLEEFMLPNLDCISPAIRELQKIPKNDSVIIGHNGVGGFGLWDISKRVILSRFSSPGNTFCQIVPISLSSWQDKVTPASYQEHEKVTNLKRNNCLLRTGENQLIPSTGKDIAVWLLVSTASHLEEQHDQVKKQSRSHSDWRLALLANNMIIMGSILDPRATAADACVDYGIIGTCDGLLYTWELSTGEKLASLHSFKCGAVSQITADAESGAIAAGKECQLLVYLPP